MTTTNDLREKRLRAMLEYFYAAVAKEDTAKHYYQLSSLDMNPNDVQDIWLSMLRLTAR